jgi:hypothetical protein
MFNNRRRISVRWIPENFTTLGKKKVPPRQEVEGEPHAYCLAILKCYLAILKPEHCICSARLVEV